MFNPFKENGCNDIDRIRDEYPESIRARRRAKNLSQADLADLVGVSRQTIVNLENGKGIESVSFYTVICIENELF